MAWITVPPTKSDRRVAKALARHTSGGTERAAQALTWGADEHVLCLLGVGWWLHCRTRNADLRRASTHVLARRSHPRCCRMFRRKSSIKNGPTERTVSGHFRGGRAKQPASTRRLPIPETHLPLSAPSPLHEHVLFSFSWSILVG